VHYTGALASTGVIFESSKDGGKTATFGLGQVIKGWQDGVPGMKVGGKRRLVIPYADAYGEAGSPPSIPAKSDLVFDIELVAVNK
jgi:FKBP-type peptidyl-prolyl cis-trans isomerase